ncbi:MAG: primosome assembly protein PriA, partial [Propionicimonas sp.]|nr:primosome assembly protein PriA [Propionicimonas sp.]
TPGAEPAAPSGYAAAVVLDTWATVSRPDLRAGEEALRRWLAVAALARPGEEGGTVLVVGEPSDRQVQAVLRIDPAGYAERELAERRATGFPPAAKLVTIEGELSLLHQVVETFQAPPGVDVRGPFEVPAGRPDEPAAGRVTLRSPLAQGADLVAAVRAMLSQRVARKAEGALRVRVDPQVVG